MTVDCSQAETMIDPLLDGELPADSAGALERHFQECPRCGGLYRDALALRGALQPLALRYRAPPGLDADLRLALRRRSGWQMQARPSWAALAASMLVAALLSAAATRQFVPPPAGADRAGPADELVDAALSSHLRALLPQHLIDVPSSDQHQVKPWFAGRIALSPVVPDLGAAGFELAGGRLDYLGDRLTAVVVYRRRAHVIDLYALPAADQDEASPPLVERQGYNMLRWRQGGIAYLAISDLNPVELAEFSRLIRLE